MTITTAINSTLLTLGPSFALYHALDLKKFEIDSTALRALAIFKICSVIKLIILAVLIPLFNSTNISKFNENTPVFVVDTV